MRTVALALACMACASVGQQREEAPTTALRSLLLARSPVGGVSSGQRTAIANRRAAGTAMDEQGLVATDTANQGRAFNVKEMAGITAPLGFFDPAGFTEGKSEGKIRFYREVEVKHGRVALLAALGFLLGENFHPLFGGNIDVPSYIAFQQTPLQNLWPVVLIAIGLLETFGTGKSTTWSSIGSFKSPFNDEPWSIRSDHSPGDLGWDPLNLKPTDAKELKNMQTKELNNGRLAMLAVAGMIAQELATGQKLF